MSNQTNNNTNHKNYKNNLGTLKIRNIITYSGKLIYNDSGDYILLSPTLSVNISTILKKTICWHHNDTNLRILKGCKIYYQEEGHLIKKLDDKYGISSYHINGLDLENVLFHLVGEYLDIEIGSIAMDENVGLGVEKLDDGEK